jgi:tripartite-type tricarboxylate transporter receptor subunit TctC
VAGGVLDVLMRSLNQVVSDWIGQPVFVENRPGASSQIALSACAKSAPDGYTLCTTSGEGMSFGPSFFASLPYNPDKDFVPITNLVWINGVIAANGNAPFNNVTEMVAYAKAKPGALNWGSFGVASTPHIYLEWIKHEAGVNITHVPYKGVAQVFPAMLAGEIETAYYAMGIVLPQARAGKVKVLAVTQPQRSPYLPNIPTLAEQGLDPGIAAWFGLFAPAHTPKPIIDQVNAEYVKALHNPNFQERFLKVQAYDAVGNSPAEFAEFIQVDRAYASRIVKITGIRADSTETPASASPRPAN